MKLMHAFKAVQKIGGGVAQGLSPHARRIQQLESVDPLRNPTFHKGYWEESSAYALEVRRYLQRNSNLSQVQLNELERAIEVAMRRFRDAG